MDWLRFSDPASDEPAMAAIAVAIGPVSEGTRHTGILHRRRGGPVELLHLAWHHRLRNEAPNLDFAWVVSSLLPERAMQVAAQCRKIARKHEKHGIPYALKYQDTRFARTAELLLGGTEHGLTCATFVLAVFRAVGVELLELETGLFGPMISSSRRS